MESRELEGRLGLVVVVLRDWLRTIYQYDWPYTIALFPFIFTCRPIYCVYCSFRTCVLKPDSFCIHTYILPPKGGTRCNRPRAQNAPRITAVRGHSNQVAMAGTMQHRPPVAPDSSHVSCAGRMNGSGIQSWQKAPQSRCGSAASLV